jgi:hypothetical protein
MLDFEPDWTYTGTAKQIEDYLSTPSCPFTFRGPGAYYPNPYRADSDTLLVLPVDREESDIWRATFGEEERFKVCVYNERSVAQIIMLLAQAPSREMAIPERRNSWLD